MGKIIEIADVQVFRKCCPVPCIYCGFIIDYCRRCNRNCPKCGTDVESIPLNYEPSDISSNDENIRT